MAESLRVVPEPIATALQPPRTADLAQLRGLIDGGREPARSDAIPPAFLRPHQVDSWRRTISALAGWQAALLAEPVGAGKTWIALAVARCWPGSCSVVGPAALGAQWARAARCAGVTIDYCSLERVSRGVTPTPAPLVIVDEAHRLRHRDTRRVTVLAPWLVGRHVLLLSATPIVNRRRDLLALLGLVVGDDALALDGIASIAALEHRVTPPCALRRLVIRSPARGVVGATLERVVPSSRVERERTARVVATVDTLRLAAHSGVHRLLAGVLLDAGASSDAAWLAALRRYRALLLHSRDAGGLSRAALRRFVGTAPEQLVLWPLMGELDREAALPIDDLATVEAALARPGTDQGWIAPMLRLLADGRPTVCFCRHRATARALATALGERCGWVTGQAAGIGPHRMPRAQLLGAFGPGRERWQARREPPTVLVATEVLAEGLDLQGASRVVHVDLPWHATRLDQRTGRVRRAGQRAANVEVVQRAVPATIDRRLGIRRRIRSTGRLAAGWLAALTAGEPAGGDTPSGTWVLASDEARGWPASAWVGLSAGSRSGCAAIDLRVTSSAFAAGGDPEWGRVRPATARELTIGSAMARRAATTALASLPPRTTRHAALVQRILVRARMAAGRRDRAQLERLDRLLSLATTVGSHGLDLFLSRLTSADDRTLLEAPLPWVPVPQVTTVRWVAVLHYRRPDGGLA